MWWAIAASTGMNMLQGMMNYNADKAQAKAQRAWQKYSNKMVDLSNSVNQNAINTNELLAADSFAAQAVQLQTDTALTTAKAETIAAAAGVKGRSVDRTLHQIMNNSAQREAERQEAFRVSKLGFEQQRQQMAMSAAMQKDYSYIPKPKAASYLLGAAMNSFNSGMDISARSR